MYFLLFLILFIQLINSIEVPPGLRPAKAVDDPEKPIVPKLEEQQEGIIDKQQFDRPSSTLENAETKTKGNDNKPLIFQKKVKENKKRVNQTPTVQGTGTPVVQQVIRPNQEEQEKPKGQVTTKFPVRTIPPPAGKDYGVNTLLQTNLVDSKGRVLKGVSSVPILVPDVRNAKSSKASASRVESEAEKPVQIKFSG
ncbi:hypothetical protein Mgra_00000254 [Meloidogyne graminicola]|uniref:Uncharacterized protein n=1 Tax=Meloidogyne graminicola TaxID=189291 RepID=A0A8T0A6A9_9BILA|nr:hypothetical protein Mgra_00000254 [Meloidogyne graminicola]